MVVAGTGVRNLSRRSLGGITGTNQIASEGVRMCESRVCKKCGGYEFYKDGHCKDCKRASNKEKYASNPEKSKARCAEWRAKNNDRIVAYRSSRYQETADRQRDKSARYRTENPDRVKKSVAAWREANKEKTSAYSKAWRAANIEKAKAYSKMKYASDPAKAKAASLAYRRANPDKVKRAKSEWRSANMEKVKSLFVAWREKNRYRLKMKEKLRRARKRSGGAKLSPDIVPRLLNLQRGKCACCGLPLGDDYHLDHIMPLALGGSNTDGNMQLLRAKCNLSKGAKHPTVFMQERGFLL